MDTCDVLIVGGGPAGSTCAWWLKRAGLDVIVMDKQAFPRDKVCAGWITPAVVDSLKLDTADYNQGRVFQPITALRIGQMGLVGVLSDYHEPVSYGIRRYEFDHYLLERSGARLETGEPLTTLKSTSEGWIVNDRFVTPMLVGAGGHFCPVARRLGNRLGSDETIVAAQELEYEMEPYQIADCQVVGENPELFFCSDLKGYGWVFRKGNFLNIGLGHEENRKLAERVEAFCEWLKRQGKIPKTIPTQFKGHAYLLHGKSKRKILDDGVLLIGDAAGLAYDQSGEGIRPAVESGLMAATTILAAQGCYRRENLEPYKKQLIHRYGSPGANGGVFSFLPTWAKQYLAKRLLANKWFSRHIVLDRWFFHAHHTPLEIS